MAFSGTDRDDSGPWFRVGKVDVTTAVFVILLWVATLLVFMVEPVDKPVQEYLVLEPEAVLSGELWRVVTWPWAHLGFGLGEVISAFIFGFFAFDLERQIGRRPLAILLGASIVIVSIAATALSSLLPGQAIIFDLDLLALTVVLLVIAEYPTRPFFFNIPAWAVGGIIVALEVVNDIAYRKWIELLTVLVAAAFIALVARKVGLLEQYDRVPDLRVPGRRRGQGGSGASSASSAKPSRGGGKRRGGAGRSGPLWGGKTGGEAEIVEMPAQRPRRPSSATVPDDLSADDVALDLLLDKISAGGMDALSPAEREQLSALRARRRGRPTS